MSLTFNLGGSSYGEVQIARRQPSMLPDSPLTLSAGKIPVEKLMADTFGSLDKRFSGVGESKLMARKKPLGLELLVHTKFS